MPKRNESGRPGRGGASSGNDKRSSGAKRAGKSERPKSPRSGRSSGQFDSRAPRDTRTSGKTEGYKSGKPPRSGRSSGSMDSRTPRDTRASGKTEGYSSGKPPRSGRSSGQFDSRAPRETRTSGKTEGYSSGKPPRSGRSSGSMDSRAPRGNRASGQGEHSKSTKTSRFGRSSDSLDSRAPRGTRMSGKDEGPKAPRSFTTGKAGKTPRFGSAPGESRGPGRGRPGGGTRGTSPRKGGDQPPEGKARFGRDESARSGSASRGASFGKPFKKTYKPKGAYDASRKTKADLAATAPVSDKIRLNKYISNSGVASRRDADELITMGLISVNGKVVTELGYKVNPGDEVRYENRVLRREKPVYILMNKPKGFITTTDDPHERKTVMHIVGNTVKERIYPVGRLDRNTTGLLLLTNDGDLADKLMHPSFNVRKVYKVELDRALTKSDFQAITDGVRLEEGRAQVDDLAIVSEDGKTVGIELHIGWNRVVRRIFESLGYEVMKLDRTVYAGLDKKELARGQWRFLTKQEIIQLKHFK